jgi:hypothetical protein
MNNLSAKIVKYLNLTLIHQIADNGVIWATKMATVYCSIDEGVTWQKFCCFPFILTRDIFSFSRLTSRIARTDKCNIYSNRYNHVIGIRAGTVYRLEKLVCKEMFSLQGDCALPCGVGEDRQGNIYICEYFRNTQRTSVKIHRIYADVSSWEIAWEFSPGEIRHIHGIFQDPYDINTLWVTTGDDDGECFFYKTTDNFKTIERIGDGTQIWRAVTLLFTPTHLCWLTDSHSEQNYACSMSRNNQTIAKHQKIDCSAWYGTTTVENNFIMFTTVENGLGIKSNYSNVLLSQDGIHWTSIYAFKKDRWKPRRLFKNGIISCPRGKMSLKKLMLSGEGLIGFDGRSIMLEASND